MNPALSDFLTALYELRGVGLTVTDEHDRSIDLYYEFLHKLGIEHCNFGGFYFNGGDSPEMSQFNGSLLPKPFLEEFTSELAADDYILLKAAELSPQLPVMSFDFGMPFLAEIAAYNPRSVRVQQESTRYGMHDGVALIGRLSRSGTTAERFFGFAFGGEIGTGKVIRSHLPELQIATFAFLDRIAPRVEATIDGFQFDISPRERDVLGALAEGDQRQQIAHRLNISVATVDMHLGRLRRKLQASTLAEAVAKAFRYGLIASWALVSEIVQPIAVL